jgi:peptidoglycan/xylan/chitin deacetylase (PgdA/CDA1 family)
MLDRFLPQIFLGKAQRALLEKGVPIFVYHNIAAAPHRCRDPFLYIGPDAFDRQLAALRAAGFSSARLDEMYETPAGANEGKNAVISFDDGCRNVWQNAAPILSKHRFQAIEFIVAGLIGKRNEWDIKHGDTPEPLMDETEIREWLAAGHAIGSHSLTHKNLAHLSRGEAREEIRASKKLLEDRFGIPVAHFCYPHGKHTPLLRELVCEAGYATACTTEFGVNDSSSPRFGLRRIFPLPAKDFAAKLRHRIARKLRSFTGKQAAGTCA